MSDDLQRLRAEIDRLDEEVLARLSRRAEIAHEIGRVKGGAVIYRPEREAQVLRRITSLNPGPLADATIGGIFREIMSACLALEQPLRIAYFGPEGTFTESAAKKHFGSAPLFSATATIDEVFRAVEAGHADYGVVPVENSTEGMVTHTLDNFVGSTLKICGEVELPIRHHLLGAPDCRLENVTRICAHQQALAQCRH